MRPIPTIASVRSPAFAVFASCARWRDFATSKSVRKTVFTSSEKSSPAASPAASRIASSRTGS